MATKFDFYGLIVDLASTKAIDVSGLSGAQIAELHNLIANEAFALIGDPEKTKKVTKFRDRETGEKRVAMMHSLVRAGLESQAAIRAEEARKEQEVAKKESAPKAAKEPKAAKAPGPTAEEKAAKKAEDKALKDAAKQAEKDAAKQKKADEKAAKKAATTPKSKFPYDGRIKVLAEKNPLKEGSEAAADFDAYYKSPTVADFMKTVGTKKGGVRLHFDLLAKRIEIFA